MQILSTDISLWIARVLQYQLCLHMKVIFFGYNTYGSYFYYWKIEQNNHSKFLIFDFFGYFKYFCAMALDIILVRSINQLWLVTTIYGWFIDLMNVNQSHFNHLYTFGQIIIIWWHELCHVYICSSSPTNVYVMCFTVQVASTEESITSSLFTVCVAETCND